MSQIAELTELIEKIENLGKRHKEINRKLTPIEENLHRRRIKTFKSDNDFKEFQDLEKFKNDIAEQKTTIEEEFDKTTENIKALVPEGVTVQLTQFGTIRNNSQIFFNWSTSDLNLESADFKPIKDFFLVDSFD